MLQGNSLIRNQILEHRVQYRQEKVNRLIQEGKHTDQFVIIVMEYKKNLKWANTCIIVRKNWPANRLISYAKKYGETAGEGVSLAAPKNGAIIQPNKTIGELYEEYHDRDDKILYLKVLISNIFGA